MPNKYGLPTPKELRALMQVVELLRGIKSLGRQYILDRLFTSDEVCVANGHNHTPLTRSADGYDREFHDNYGGEYIEIPNREEMAFEDSMIVIDRLLKHAK